MNAVCSQQIGCSERVVCRCLQVTELELVEAITTQDLQTLKEVRQQTGAGDGCTACHRLLKKYLDQQAVVSSVPLCPSKIAS